MRSSFVATTGLKLIRTPSVRQQTARRRMAVVGAVLGFAILSGAVGFLTAPHGSTEPGPRTGPFSYFPSQ